MTQAKINPERAPQLRGEYLYIPFVGAIIEREFNGKKQILVQTREKEADKKYSGSIEIPGGKYRAFEDIYESLRREAREESGMEITFVVGEDKREDFLNREDHAGLIYPYCITQIKEGPFIGLIFLCRAEGEPIQQTNETKEAHWLDIEELKHTLKDKQQEFYTPFLAALIKYAREN